MYGETETLYRCRCGRVNTVASGCLCEGPDGYDHDADYGTTQATAAGRDGEYRGCCESTYYSGQAYNCSAGCRCGECETIRRDREEIESEG